MIIIVIVFTRFPAAAVDWLVAAFRRPTGHRVSDFRFTVGFHADHCSRPKIPYPQRLFGARQRYNKYYAKLNFNKCTCTPNQKNIIRWWNRRHAIINRSQRKRIFVEIIPYIIILFQCIPTRYYWYISAYCSINEKMRVQNNKFVL